MRPTIEQLEARDCPSAPPTLTQGVTVLSYPQSPGAGVCKVIVDNSTGQVDDVAFFAANGSLIRQLQGPVTPGFITLSPVGFDVTDPQQIDAYWTQQKTQVWEAASLDGANWSAAVEIADLSGASLQQTPPPTQQAPQQAAPVQSGTAVRAVVVPVSPQPVSQPANEASQQAAAKPDESFHPAIVPPSDFAAALDLSFLDAAQHFAAK